MEKTENLHYTFKLKPEIHIPSGTCNITRFFTGKFYGLNKQENGRIFIPPITSIPKCCHIPKIT